MKVNQSISINLLKLIIDNEIITNLIIKGDSHWVSLPMLGWCI